MKRSIFLVCFVVFGVVSLSAIGSIVSVAQSGWQTDSISYGISRMVDIASLPLLDRGISVHYEGSIDKRGKNSDWDWSLYQDQRGEWVIFDVDGPGCIYNLVQHRYMSSSDPLFRFYFDGEETPRFSLHLSEFGEKEPFIKPLAESYIGPFAICRTFSGESANFLYCLGWVDIYEREIFWVCALFLAVISVRNP